MKHQLKILKILFYTMRFICCYENQALMYSKLMSSFRSNLYTTHEWLWTNISIVKIKKQLPVLPKEYYPNHIYFRTSIFFLANQNNRTYQKHKHIRIDRNRNNRNEIEIQRRQFLTHKTKGYSISSYVTHFFFNTDAIQKYCNGMET